MDTDLRALLLGREFSAGEEELVSAVLVLLGRRYMRLARLCRDGYLEQQSLDFMEAAQMITELRSDLFGLPALATDIITMARRDREALLRVMGVLKT